jgi:hypothetical protein
LFLSWREFHGSDLSRSPGGGLSSRRGVTTEARRARRQSGE